MWNGSLPMEGHPGMACDGGPIQCLDKISDDLALSGSQFMVLRKFCEGLAGRHKGHHFFAYDGRFHGACSHALRARGARKLPSRWKDWPRVSFTHARG